MGGLGMFAGSVVDGDGDDDDDDGDDDGGIQWCWLVGHTTTEAWCVSTDNKTDCACMRNQSNENTKLTHTQINAFQWREM